MRTALVSLQSQKRFTFRLWGSDWIVFDNARCCFIFPEWVACPQEINIFLDSGLKSRGEVKAQCERDFEEVQRVFQEFDRWMETYLRAFAAGSGIPYDLLIVPIPKAHEEELCLK